MGSWVLILTLMASDGTQIHSISGFPNNLSCDSAGETWKKNADKTLKTDYSFYQCEYLDK